MKFDTNKMMRTVSYPPMHKRISILLFSSTTMFIISSYRITVLVCVSFFLPHIVNMWETLLLKTITESIQKKFSILNNMVHNQKIVSMSLWNVLPLSNPQTAEKFKQQAAALTAEGIFDIMELHYSLTALGREVNELFQYPVLMTTALNFEVITISVYSFVSDISITTQPLLKLINTLIWPTVLSVQIVLIIRSFQEIDYKVQL